MRGCWLIMALAAAGLAVSAQAAEAVDQNQPTFTATRGIFFLTIPGGASASYSQTFLPSATRISGIGVNLTTTGADPETMAIDDGFRATLLSGSTILTSTSLGTLDTVTGWLDAVWTPIAVTAGSVYTLKVDFFGGSASPLGRFALNAAANDPYSQGRMTDSFSSFDAITGTTNTVNDFYTSGGNYDITFRTFAPVIASAVPEPTTWAMTISGFLAGGAIIRRRRNNEMHRQTR